MHDNEKRKLRLQGNIQNEHYFFTSLLLLNTSRGPGVARETDVMKVRVSSKGLEEIN